MYILPEKTVSKIIIKNSADENLFLIRSDTHPLYKGQLDLPGGMSEKNESPIKTALRELKEETGLIPGSALSLLFYKRIPTPNEAINYYLYLINIDSQEQAIELSNEHKSFKNISLEQIKNLDLSQLTDNYILSAIDFMKQNPTLIK